jgi:hypothetical protein
MNLSLSMGLVGGEDDFDTGAWKTPDEGEWDRSFGGPP